MKRIAVAMRERTRQHDSQLVTATRAEVRTPGIKKRNSDLELLDCRGGCHILDAGQFGAGSNGDLVGTVTDANGAVIPNAKVTVLNADTQQQRAMTTSSTGDYVFTLLQPGTYTIRVEQKSFRAMK